MSVTRVGGCNCGLKYATRCARFMLHLRTKYIRDMEGLASILKVDENSLHRVVESLNKARFINLPAKIVSYLPPSEPLRCRLTC
jgi:hypothetical protein